MAKFVISREKILAQYQRVADACDVVSYSSKTNPIVTETLESQTESMFSIHMANELAHVNDKSRVLFLAQAWDQEEIAGLVAVGVRWFVVDNERDLDELLGFLDGFDGTVNVLLRVKLREHTLRTEKYFVFGMPSEVVNRRLLALRGHAKVEKLGVHFHRKTQNMAEWSLRHEFSQMIAAEALENVDIVCIGGGLPSEYANTNARVLNGIFSRIAEFREFLTQKGVSLMIEPGRFIAAPAGKLHTKIVRVHGNTIVVDASVYNSDLDALIVPVKLLIEGELRKEEAQKFSGNVRDSKLSANSGDGGDSSLSESVRDDIRPYVVKGITPCSMDLFRYRVYLPENLVKEGKELVFLNAGAYNFGTDFCSLDRLESEIV